MFGPFFQLPFGLLAGLFLVVGLFFLFIFIQVGLFTAAFAKLGLTPFQGLLLLLATLFGSGVNLPVWKTKRLVPEILPGRFFVFGPGRLRRFETGAGLREQVVAVNLGGCLIPVVLSLSFLARSGFHPAILLCTAATAAVCWKVARPTPGVGIAVPLLIPPLTAALSALLLAPPELAPHAAYTAGSMGVLLGADVLRLADRRTFEALDAPVLSIGGAGTFDAIFLGGLLAALLA